MSWFSRGPEAMTLKGLSDEGFKRLAKDLYDNAYLDTIDEIRNGPWMNVFIDRETGKIDVRLCGAYAEALRRKIRIRSIEDEYR